MKKEAADDNNKLQSGKLIWDGHVNSNNAGSDSWELMSKLGAEVEGDDKGHEECDNIESSTNQYSQLFMDLKDGGGAASKHRIRASLKACTLKWRKAVRKHESKPSLDGCASLQVNNPLISKPEVITLP
jgi:hypothetical protein